MRALQHARPFLRRELARRMTSKNTPDLDFRLDTSMERAQELTEIMRRNLVKESGFHPKGDGADRKRNWKS